VCDSCKEIMMCACDKEYGERYLPHQLKYGSLEGSQERIPVTLGFQANVCPECRGQKPVAAPKAPMHGATTKITRYYWREIFFETTKRFYNSHPELDPNDPSTSEFNFPEERKRIRKQVIAEIKTQHDINPKYEYNELSQAEVIDVTNTEVVLISAEHVQTEGKKIGIRDGSTIRSVEEFSSEYFKRQGYSTLEVESVPFHVLFGVFMYLVVQEDARGRIVQFGSRNDFDNGNSEEGLITTILPDDFGSKLYYERQKNLIVRHLNELDDLEWLFDYWLDHSSDFRQYLWAHRAEDVMKAKQVMSILGLDNLKKVLHYLIMNYWKNYCGWPDLLVYNSSDFFCRG
jgi:hypothetical protein